MVPSTLIPALASAADLEINNVLRTGAAAFNQKRPTGEVGFVAAFVLGGVPAIAQAWRPILQPAGLSVRMTGVLVHQNPYVDFLDHAGNSGRCELADLLVVADDLTSGVPGKRWAALVQAKMASPGGGATLSSQGDLNQLDLLTRWPPFTMPTTFAPGHRDFSGCPHPGSTLDCGSYGLIDGQPNPIWHQQPPANPVPAGGDELGTFLAKMLERGQVGYGREATGVSDDWSRTVDELLRVTGAMTFSYISGFKGRQQRSASAVALVVDTAPFDGFAKGLWFDSAPPHGGRPEQPAERDAEGISVLRIAIGNGEEEVEPSRL